MITIYAHEIVETVTDTFGAWYFDSGAVDSSGSSLAFSENADACVWNFGNFDGNANVMFGPYPFLVQMNWVPGYGCLMQLPSSLKREI